VITNYCVALNYADNVQPEELRQAHAHYGQVLGAIPFPPGVTPMQRAQFPNKRDPEKRLRVGILSSDLFDHSVAYFVRPFLAQRDRAKVEYILYSAGPRQDEITRRLQEQSDGWRDASRMNDAQLIGQARQDALDILIELSGQTQRNRLMAVRLRGAPVQATYIGYPNTTGLRSVDYRFVDSITDPAGAEAQAVEKLVRLDPCFLCYWPREDAPVPGPAPALRNGYITFGSFNSIKKLAPSVIRCWCRLLQQVPDSRLILKSAGFNSERACQYLDSVFDEFKIAEDRVELRDRVDSKSGHLSAYDEMDIALDTFPYNGTTTTCEALWMGVPVVTMAGKLHAGRVGASLLSAVGLPELVGQGEDDYVRIAAGLAADQDRLADLRRGMRERVAGSALCDAKAFAERFEGALRGIWKSFCAANP
jgi:predicted O-linked N-acetylglucosamine transferase (SPINDLY family)